MVLKIIFGPNRAPDSIVGPLWLYYVEGFLIDASNKIATKLEIRDGRVGIYMDDEWLDMGDMFAFDYMTWLLDVGLSVHKYEPTR